MKAYNSILSKIGIFFRKVATATVNGLPREKLIFKPEKKTVLHAMKHSFKTDSKKYYHRPISKPVVELKSLLKEKKKAKTVH